MKIAIVLQVPPRRIRFLKTFEEVIRRCSHLFDEFELFLLHDHGRELQGMSTFLLDMDRTVLTIKGPDRNPFHFNINVAAGYMRRERPDIDAMLITHPECLLLGVLEDCVSSFRPDTMVVFQAHKTSETIFDLIRDVDLKTVDKDYFAKLAYDHPGSLFRTIGARYPWWWYAVLIPVYGYCAVGGVDERIILAPAAGDDQFGWSWTNSGRHVRYSIRGLAVHLYHSEQTSGMTEEMRDAYRIVEDYKLNPSMRHSNPGWDWEHADAIQSVYLSPANEVLYAAV